MQLVYKAANVTEAQIVRGMLEASGIDAHVGGYYLQGGVGEMSTMDFANVQVHDSDVTQAREIIREYEQTPSEGTPRASRYKTPGTGVNAKLAIVLGVALITGLLLIASGVWP